MQQSVNQQNGSTKMNGELLVLFGKQSKLIATPKPKELHLGSKINRDVRVNLIEIAETNKFNDIFDITFNKKELKLLFEPIS